MRRVKKKKKKEGSFTPATELYHETLSHEGMAGSKGERTMMMMMMVMGVRN